MPLICERSPLGSDPSVPADPAQPDSFLPPFVATGPLNRPATGPGTSRPAAARGL